MDNARLPDLERLKDVKQRIQKLPPQTSSADTSNWENRNVSAVTFDTDTKAKKVRDMEFILAESKPLPVLSEKESKELARQERSEDTSK